MIVLADSNGLVGFYVFLGIFVTVLILISVFAGVNSSKNKKVLESSPYIASILELNKRYSFKTIATPKETVSISLKSKKSFDSFNPEMRFGSLISERLAYFQSLIEDVDSNVADLAMYKMEFGTIPLTSDEALAKSSRMSLKSFQERELKLGERLLQKPAIDYSLKIKWHYTSPAGKNHYSNYRVYPYKKVKEAVVRLTPASKTSMKEKKKAEPKPSPSGLNEANVEEVE